jgi:YD repeat-containing protein
MRSVENLEKYTTSEGLLGEPPTLPKGKPAAPVSLLLDDDDAQVIRDSTYSAENNIGNPPGKFEADAPTEARAFTAIEEAVTAGTGDIDKATNKFRTGTSYDDAGQVLQDDKVRDMGFAYDANGRVVKATRANTRCGDCL